MDLKTVTVMILVLSEVLNVSCSNCESCRRDQSVRVKRAKYHSNAPPRFYRRPPPSAPVRGPFSYTPPPGYGDDERRPAPPPHAKVSTATADGLADDDINNIVKYLSKKDLDKLIEFAGEKERITDKYSYRQDPNDKYVEYSKPPPGAEVFLGDNNSDYEVKKFAQNGLSLRNYDDDSQYQVKYSHPGMFNSVQETRPSTRDAEQYHPKYSFNKHHAYNPQNFPTSSLNSPYQNQEAPPQFDYNSPNPNFDDAAESRIVYTNIPENYNRPAFTNMPMKSEESVRQNQYSLVSQSQGAGAFGWSDVEEPSKLQEPLQAEFSSKVPAVAAAYNVESFGDLPLMEYHNSKLHTVSSYKVPHYTVTSGLSSPASPASAAGASAASAALAQSDAHLKAVRIWAHRSKGTAYTLHDDGTLSLEGPPPRGRAYGRP